MLLLSGGVSAGKYDLVEEVLLSLGAEFFFTGVEMQPGKPAVFGRIPATPGHAAAVDLRPARQPGLDPGDGHAVCHAACCAPSPARPPPGPSSCRPHSDADVTVRPGLTRFLPARMESTLEGATVRPTGWQGSGDLHSNARANCYLVVPPTAETLPKDSTVTLLLR